MAENRLQRINGDESFKTHSVETLNLEANSISAVEPRLAEIMPQISRLYLNNNSIEYPDGYLATVTERIRGIAIGDNPFRCDCLRRGARSQAPEWVSSNSDRILDIERAYCVENVTRAFLENDTNVLSRHPPNSGDDLFVIQMLKFLQENE